MSIIRLKNPSRKQVQKTKINRNLSWYDVDKKKMITFVGGRLSFRYEYDNTLIKPKYRLLPYIEDVEESKEIEVIDLGAIDKWLRSHQNSDFVIDIIGREQSGSVLLTILEDESQDVMDSLDVDGIIVEVM